MSNEATAKAFGTKILSFEAAQKNAGGPVASMASARARLFPEAAPIADSSIKLSLNDRISFFGEQFASDISRYMTGLGAQVVSAPGVAEDTEMLPLVATPADLLQEVLWAWRIFKRGEGLRESDCFALTLSDRNESVFDVQYSSAFQSDISTIVARRTAAYETFQRALSAKVIFLLPSHTEVWQEPKTGLFLSAAERLAASPEIQARLTMVSLGYERTVKMLETAIAGLVEMQPGLRVILGVSPNNMPHTHSNQDVLIANVGAKSMLRVACDAICQRTRTVSYFPCYESALLTRQAYVYANDNVTIEANFIGSIAAGLLAGDDDVVSEEALACEESAELARSGNIDAAIDRLMPLIDRDGFLPGGATMLAGWLLRQRRYADAQAVIEAQYSKSRRHPDLAHALRAALIGQGDLEGALKAAEEAAEGRPDLWTRELDVANILFRLGRLEEADTIFQRQLENMDRFIYKVQYARVLLKMGQRERMIELLDPSLDPDVEIQALIEAVRILKSASAMEAAERIVEYASELYPDHQSLSLLKD